MAFEYLDLENKLLIPTQTLWAKLQVELINLYANARQFLIEAHDTVATLGLEWYDAPVLTTTKWYEHSVALGHELYVKAIDEVWPQVEVKYDEMLVGTNDFATKTLDSFNYVVENPEKVTAESIEFLTESVTEAGNVSAELATELQSKGAEIVALLLEQPMQTLESAYMDVLTTLLNGYFELVSSILISL